MADSAQLMVGEALVMAGTSERELECLVRDHSQLVFRIAYSVVRNHADAEDVTQEVFLRVLRNERKLVDILDPKAWLARIAWRVSIDRKRAGSMVSLDDEAPEGASTLRSLCDSGADAETVAADRQMLRLMEQLIAGLPRDLRDVTVLATVDELSTRELAEVLEIPEATVRTRLFRARQLLRGKLAKVLQPPRAGRAADRGGNREL